MPEAMDKPRVVVLTGAGISAESGIQTFRAADGLWEEHRVEDVATPEGFTRDPALVQAFYNARRRQLQQPEIAPNAAHLALAKLEEALGSFSAGHAEHRQSSRKGRKPQHHSHARRTAQGAVRMEWSGAGLEEDVLDEDRCHCCQFPSRLRPHVVWFGEMPLGMDEIYSAWLWRTSLSPLALRDMSIRRQDLFTKRDCKVPIRWSLIWSQARSGASLKRNITVWRARWCQPLWINS